MEVKLYEVWYVGETIPCACIELQALSAQNAVDLVRGIEPTAIVYKVFEVRDDWV